MDSQQMILDGGTGAGMAIKPKQSVTTGSGNFRQVIKDVSGRKF